MPKLIVLLPILFVGCSNYPSSSVPLCTDAEAFRDDRIVGDWRLKTARPTNERQRFISFDDTIDATSVLKTGHVSVSRENEGDQFGQRGDFKHFEVSRSVT